MAGTKRKAASSTNKDKTSQPAPKSLRSKGSMRKEASAQTLQPQTPPTPPRPLAPEWQDFVDNPNLNFLLSFDFGSSKCAIARAFESPITTVINVNIDDIQTTNGSLISSLIGFMLGKNAKGQERLRVFYGHQVASALKNGDLDPDCVFVNLKQSKLFEDIEQVEHAARREYLEELHKYQQGVIDCIKGKRAMIEHEWYGSKDAGVIESGDDVARIFFGLILLDAKLDVQRRSGMSKDTIDELFEGDRGTILGRKFRAGVAVPDFWHKQRLTLYNLMVEAGWSTATEILSESKNAGAKVLKEKVTQLQSINNDIEATVRKRYIHRVLHIIDRGGHTLDQTSMKIVVQDGVIRFKPVIDSTSTPDGGDRANDEFGKLLPTLFGSSYSDLLKHAKSDGQTINKFRFKHRFMESFEFEKKESASGQSNSLCDITYDNRNQTLPDGNNGKTSWKNNKLSFEKKHLRRCVRKPVEAILSPNGPLEKHHDATKEAVPNAVIDMIATGGGSADSEFRKQVQKKFQYVSFESVAHNAQSYVARGGILSLLDRDICNDAKLANKSYGIVVTIAFNPRNEVHQRRAHEATAMPSHLSQEAIKGKRQLENSVVWLTRQRNHIRVEETMTPMSQQIPTGGTHPNDMNNGVVFEVEIVMTDREDLSSQDGISAATDGIVKVTTFRIPISMWRAKKIARPLPDAVHGFVVHADAEDDEDWVLEFDYQFSYKWAGMMQILEVRIPYGGAFPLCGELSPKEMYIARCQLTGDVAMAADAGNDA